MKKFTLLIAIGIINVSLLCAQDMLLKELSSTTSNNFHVSDYYKYDANWKLDSVIRVTELGDTTRLLLFENDSLKSEVQSSFIWTYDYYGIDSIVEFTSSQVNGWNEYKSGVYYLGSDFEMTSYKILDYDENIIWTVYYTFQNGNCIEILNYGGILETMDYSSYLNPHLGEKKYFRRAYQGSINFMEYGDFSNKQYEFDVISSLNNYPTIADIYIDNEFFSTHEYEYFNFTDVTQIDEMPEILEVNYFNLLGQKIDMPKKGFYIERISTNKGIISKKKYAY